MNGIFEMFCRIAITLVKSTEKKNGEQLTKNDNITISFESDGRKYTVCITVEEAKE